MVVSTGQMTIVDHNDAKPITAFISASLGISQAYSKDESATVYNPNYPSGANILTPKVYAGSTTDVTALLTNRKWSTDLSTSLGSGVTFSVSANLTTDSVTYYFEGDYTDINTGLITHVIAEITLIRNKLGTNAVFVRTRGIDVIENSASATKNVGQIAADLMRASGVDDTGITYKWWKLITGSWVPIETGFASIAAFGYRTTAQSNAGSGGGIGVNIPAAGAWTDIKELFIREDGIADIGYFQVQAKDADAVVYQAFFTVYDISDPYAVNILSTAGDKFQNGIGSTQLTPEVWYGDTEITDLTGWTFYWTMKDKSGNPAGYIDTAKTPAAKAVTANTSIVITLQGTFPSPPVAADVVKLVKADGTIKYFEVASATNTTNATVTIKTTGITATFLTILTSLTASELIGASLFVCSGNGTGKQGTRSTSAGAAITVTGDEVDTKNTFSCEATRP